MKVYYTYESILKLMKVYYTTNLTRLIISIVIFFNRYTWSNLEKFDSLISETCTYLENVKCWKNGFMCWLC
jgi:hypothetical protein